jgi:hypothetical protein
MEVGQGPNWGCSARNSTKNSSRFFLAASGTDNAENTVLLLRNARPHRKHLSRDSYAMLGCAVIAPARKSVYRANA